MNIKFQYRYRDGANYKNNGCEVFSNSQSIPVQEIDARIRSHLIDETWFYADEWKVKDLHLFTWDDEIDHAFHEYDSVEETEETTTKGDIAALLDITFRLGAKIN